MTLSAFLAGAGARLRTWSRAALRWLAPRWAALATGATGLLAWACLTSAAAIAFGGVTWRVSVGLLCLSLFGWKFAFVIARDGVYTLTRPKRGDR